MSARAGRRRRGACALPSRGRVPAAWWDRGSDCSLARHTSAGQLEAVVRGLRRARFNTAAEADPTTAAWTLRTRTRYDDHGNFTLTISGPAQYLPVVQAGIEAKKAELQRQRDTAAAGAAAVPEPEDVPAETPESQDVPAGRPEPKQDAASDGFPSVEEPGLDEQAPGWPTGTTVRDVHAAMDGFFLSQARLDDPGDEPAEPPVARVSDTASPAPVRNTAGVPAGTPCPEKVTDAEALLALAQDALAAEQTAHPGMARCRRPQLTAQIDPVSGWGRLADGELLAPTSLRAVMKTLPGRGGQPGAGLQSAPHPHPQPRVHARAAS